MYTSISELVKVDVMQYNSVPKVFLSVFISLHIFKFLLFTGSDISSMSSGRRFMIDLLVSSLMADGGLEMALDAAIKCKDLQMCTLEIIKSLFDENIFFIYFVSNKNLSLQLKCRKLNAQKRIKSPRARVPP